MGKKKQHDQAAAAPETENHQESLLRVLQHDLTELGFGDDGDVSGAELVEVMGVYYERIKHALETPLSLRVQTWQGLRPIRAFDAIEVYPMVEDGEGGLIQASDDPDATPCAFTVFLHLREGGIETVRDFVFDPTETGAMDRAAKEAADCATSLEDMLQVAGSAYPRMKYTAEELVSVVVVNAPQSRMR